MKDIDLNSQDILNFRPKIEFVEPDQEPFEVKALPEAEPLSPNFLKELKGLAVSTEVLAIATQAKIDERASTVCIKLHPKIDSPAMQAMRRIFGKEVDSEKICYQQYRYCKDKLREYGNNNARKPLITKEDIEKARGDLQNGKVSIGGLNTPESLNGDLRPEADSDSVLIPQIDLEEMQLELIKVLFNFGWRNIILPAIQPVIPFPLPEEIIEVNDITRRVLDSLKALNVPVLS